MSRTTGSVFRHAAVFGLAPVLQKVVSALLLPWFTHYLAREEYGLRDLLLVVSGLFPVLFLMEYRVGFVRRFVALRDDAERRALFTASALGMTLLGLVAAATLLAGWPLVRVCFPSADVPFGFRAVLAASVFLDVVQSMLLSGLQARMLSSRMVAITLIQFAVGVGANVGFVVYLRLGAFGLFLGNAVASLLATLLLLHATRSLWTRPEPWPALWRRCAPALRYSLPLWAGGLVYYAMQNVDRALLAPSLATLGVYGMARKLSHFLVLLVLVPFQRSFDVWRFEIHASKEDPRTMAEVHRLFLFAAAFFALALTTVGGDLFAALADPAYDDALRYLPWMTLAILFQCSYVVTSSAYYVTGRTGAWVRLFVLATILQTLACVGLDAWLGAEAIVFGLLVGHGGLALAAATFGRRHWAIPYAHGRTLAMMIAATALALSRRHLAVDGLAARLVLDSLGLAAFLVLGRACAWIEPAELRRILEWVRRRGPLPRSR